MTVKEYSLDNNWRVTFTNLNPEAGEYPYALHFDVERNNGGEWEHEVSGQVKRDGCVDIGFNQPTMMHFCGAKDYQLFPLLIADALILCEVQE